MTNAETTPGGAATAEPSDADLLARTRAGDKGAYDELFRRHKAAAHGLAKLYTRQNADREDLVSTAFADIYQTITRGAGPTEAFRPYLLTCVRRLGGRHATSTSEVLVDISDGAIEVEDEGAPRPEDTVEAALATSAFAALPGRWQTALWHSVVEGESHESVGRYLGLNAHAAAALVSRAKEGLRVSYLAQHVAAEGATCAVSAAELAGLTRGRISEAATARLAAHVASCASCTARMEELGHVDATMRASVAPAVLGLGVAPYLAAEKAARAGLAAWLASHVPQVAAGVLTVVIAAGLLWWASSDEQASAGPAPSVTASDAAAPPIVSTSPDPVAPSSEPTQAESPAVAISPTPEPATAEASAPATEAAPSDPPRAESPEGATYLAQSYTPLFGQGASGKLRVDTGVAGGGAVLRIVLPEHVSVDRSMLGPACSAASDTELSCAPPAGEGTVDVPVLVSRDAPLSTRLEGGSAWLESQGGVVGPIALTVTTSGEPCV